MGIKIQQFKFPSGSITIQSVGTEDLKDKIISLSDEIKNYSDNLIPEQKSLIYNFIKKL